MLQRSLAQQLGDCSKWTADDNAMHAAVYAHAVQYSHCIHIIRASRACAFLRLPFAASLRSCKATAFDHGRLPLSWSCTAGPAIMWQLM